MAPIYQNSRMGGRIFLYSAHRNRAGVGGIFMDDRLPVIGRLTFALTREVGRAFLPAYVPLVEKRKSQVWSELIRTCN
jgi:coproporphyrinogen III oxidase